MSHKITVEQSVLKVRRNSTVDRAKEPRWCAK